MNSISILKMLIEKLEDYEQHSDNKDDLSFEGFHEFIKPEKSLDDLTNSFVSERKFTDHGNPHSIDNNIERVIAQHLLFMYRYIKFYSKMAFVGTRIRSIEEFGIMITVMQFSSISKTDLIKRNILEKSSGIEIINRLVKNGMLIQTHNPNDHRSQLISLTDTGRTELFMSFEKMNMLGKISTGELNAQEKSQLASILKKLDKFHYENYMNKDIDTLEDYLPPQH